MATLKANDDMRREVTALIKSGRISRSAYDHAVRNGYSDADIIKVAEENRLRKARMAISGSPTLYRPPQLDVVTNAPTGERQRKAEGWRLVPAGKELGAPRVYKDRTVLDQYGDKYTTEMRLAMERFFQDAQYSDRVRTADLNPSGGGVPGKRLGGLGNVTDTIRLAHTRFQWIWPHLSDEARATAQALITRDLRKPNDTPFSMEDFGAHIMPWVIDKNRRWGVSAGALWQFAAQLVHLYAHCPYRVRWGEEDDDEARYELRAILEK